MAEPRLFADASFVVTHTPGRFGRALLKLARGVDSDLVVEFHALTAGDEPSSHRPPVIGRIAPRTSFPRGAFAYGVMEVTGLDGATVAHVTNTDMFNNVVEIAPAAGEPLRTLTVAFACSLVDHGWMHIPTRGRP